MKVARTRRVLGIGGNPGVCARVIFAAAVQKIASISSAPDNHFVAGPNSCLILTSKGCVVYAGRDPTVCLRIVSAAGVKTAEAAAIPAPNDHFRTTPDCGVSIAGVGRSVDP